ncbi:hypothetical protein RBWH47_02704 [Rhodopirellula baltica WH47]|uniref:Uncharacterized protein n=1 Tax=Rhodopirellula baltica WH47 TaxID=991778 RepID=F2B1K2_RHOBT|nr:hypothetical protein RBWH47_02704 [Rhodopirellula baltica WH47]
MRVPNNQHDRSEKIAVMQIWRRDQETTGAILGRFHLKPGSRTGNCVDKERLSRTKQMPSAGTARWVQRTSRMPHSKGT